MADNNNLPSWEETLARLNRAVKLQNKVVNITRGRKKQPTDEQKKKLLKALLESLIKSAEEQKKE